MNAMAAALHHQSTIISPAMRARSITKVLEMLRHWLREAEMMLPTGPLVPEAETYQTGLIAAELRNLGANLSLIAPNTYITLLGITVHSSRGGLELFHAWAEAAQIALIHINKQMMADPSKKGAA